jgi:hypothetical protein
MNGISYAPLQLWELFHLEVLRRLAQKLKPGQYALKGGVNMRFFFGSPRYSEDIDLYFRAAPSRYHRADPSGHHLRVRRPHPRHENGRRHIFNTPDRAGFFFGFDWYKETADFLVAAPEKALLDCLYLSGRKGNQFKYFPELRFPPSFSFPKAGRWTRLIKDPRLRNFVIERLGEIQKSSGA